MIWENNTPKLVTYNLKINKEGKLVRIKEELDNQKPIVLYQISDLHNYKFGKRQEKIIELLGPNRAIFLTGDLIDRRNPSSENAVILLEELNKKYPNHSYYVTGNHEKGTAVYQSFKKALEENQVRVLDDERVEFDNFNLIGVNDPSEYISINIKKVKSEIEEVESKLQELIDKDKINILLSHRPEFIEIYVDNDIDLVFSGHAHGGQVRVMNKPLYAPNQGMFPEYAGGLFKVNNTIMINSAGLGNNFAWAKRVNNRPQVVKVNLYTHIWE